jgi:Xaa-Pro aminopeptidase
MTMLVAAAAVAVLRAGDLSDDLAARRVRVMDRLGPDAMLVLLSAPARPYSLDVDYEYRQDSNLYYLTALAQESTSLVLMPGNGTRREIVFVKDKDPAREHWRGRVLSHAEVTARTGIHTVLSAGQLDAFLAAILARRTYGGVDDKDAAKFFEALDAGRARVAFVMDAAGVDDPTTPVQDLARKLRERFAGFQTVDATRIFADLRLVKTPYERTLLAKATEISAEAHKAGMRAARPGAFEYEVKAAVEAVHRGRGAISWAYPSIVGSGPNATILHYPGSDRRMHNGELLLVDAACNFEYMSPDITRTYPVGGTFTPAQKDIYRLVLEAQEEAIKVAQIGSSLTAVHQKTVEVIKAGLLRIGLITDATGDQYRMWYTHSAVHYIGIDVHDVGERSRTLQAGMAFVIEPGLYIRQSAIDALPRTADNLALIEKIQPAVKKYADIGIRVEDSFLLEESGLRRLSTAAPRTIEEIEAFMRQPASSR